jgi:ABC-type molybdate transport system substrate-binding protein
MPRFMHTIALALLLMRSSGVACAADAAPKTVRAATDKVEGIGLPAGHNVTARYPIAALGEAANPDAAHRFVDFVLSVPGQTTLEGYGFLSP